ncbi:MAG TPA: heparinase II/III family protein, partial [Armatimonadota bacterium]|nr:heparinase II/III family protein [Armatimonadota bacterium]
MNVLLIIVLILTVGTASWAKSERTYYTEEMMTRMSEKIAAREWAKAQVEAAKSDAAWYIAMSDQEIWDFVPPPEQLRAINVHIGHDCPNCGPEITRKAGHYPWILDRDKPFKLTCPSCDLVFPENDFEPWNTEGLDGTPETGTAIIDKGLGWIGPEDRQYYFVPYYIFWQRWVRDILGGMRTLGRAYLVTGDPEYGRKCAIMMAKVASEYERFDYGKQAYHEGKFNIPGRISDRIWSTGDDSKICLAYDAIFPAFADDDVLLAFLADKGIADPRDLIEQKMLNVMAEDVMSAFVAGNMGMHQRTLCHLAIVLANDDPANGPTTEQMRDWIMTGPGRVEDLLWNGFWRDGLGSESSPSYSSSWCNNFYSIADLLPRLGVEIWDNPKLKRMADVGLDTTVAGAYCPSIGDSGGMKASGPIARSVGLQGRAFTHYGDARYAKALALMNATSRDLFEDYFDEDAVATVVAEEGTDLGLATRDLGGYGLAVLESGEGDHKRAATMYYGFAGGGHGHRDRLNIQMWAYKKAMLTEDGYPFPFTRPDFWAWRSTDTVKHYCVVVDETTQRTQHAGDLNTLASTPTVQFMDASAEVAYPAMVSLYRRTTAMIDISDEDSYLLDIFRVRGGSQHDWCFHGPGHFELSVGGGEFGPTQEQGTLAGENVPYGTRPPRGMTDGVTLDLLAAKGLTTEGEYRDTSREGWAQFGQCILVRKEGASVTLDMPELPAGRIKVAMRIYDYNEGSNTVDVTISGVTQSIDCEPSGTVGYRWISGEMDIPTPATEVMLG